MEKNLTSLCIEYTHKNQTHLNCSCKTEHTNFTKLQNDSQRKQLLLIKFKYDFSTTFID